jgi:predicted glycoside hydrolase/deacetylase ChbG (UPF0249 family)
MLAALVVAHLVSATLSAAEPLPALFPDPSQNESSPQPRLIVRLDDMGFCHAANLAFQRVLDEGVCTSVSLMVTTPWLDEAVKILRRHPEVSVGVHLTLNAEWREYRWGPVLPYSQVPSLVDENGKFFGTRREFMANGPRVDELEQELRAQIELALRKGVKVSYVDYHMGTAVSTREFQEVVEKLAREYKLGISQYFGETYAPNVYRFPPEQKLAEAIRIIEEMNEPKLYLFVAHPGLDTPEMAALTDLNPTGLKPMAAHRQAVTDLLCNPALKAAIGRKRLRFVNYDDLKAQGLDRMKRPWLADPYGQVRDRSSKPD